VKLLFIRGRRAIEIKQEYISKKEPRMPSMIFGILQQLEKMLRSKCPAQALALAIS
jgi:hypothetical protein